MTTLRPSPTITVSEHTSIGEAIQTLIDHKVGSVIIVSYSKPHQAVGIFTEHDLLKWVFSFKDNNLWNVAIGTIMSRNLIKLSISELDQANQVMLQNNIRHLPIIYHDDSGEEHLAGVISMRDAFRALVLENNQLLKKLDQNNHHKKITLLAKNLRDQQLQNKVLSDHAQLHFIEFSKELMTKELLDTVLDSVVFILDIDQLTIHFWPILLKTILDQPKHPEVFIVYSPAMHEKKNIDAVKIIAAGKAVHAFAKPLELLQYISQIKGSIADAE